MRSGCLGCFTGLALAVVLGLSIGLAAWTIARALQLPGRPVPSAGTTADGARAQQKIYEVVRHVQRAGERVTLTEPEINALLTHHLEEGSLPLERPAVKLVGAGVAEFSGQVPLVRLLAEPPLRSARNIVPHAWLDRPVSVRIEGRPRIALAPGRDKRHLKIDVERAWIGRQRVPVLALKIILSPSDLRVLSWPVPAEIAAVNVEPGRLVVRLASAR